MFDKVLEKLNSVEARHQELEGLLADPAVAGDQKRYQKYAKEFSDLTPLVDSFRAYQETLRQIDELRKILGEKQDKDFQELAEAELEELEVRQESLEAELKEAFNPRNREKDVDIIIEIRAGTGGQEAGLFAGDLYRMYTKYAETKGWTVEAISSHESEAGGFKEVVFSVSGEGASKRLKWEGGTHRVQRVPATEASGRIHTSAATVAVLREPEDVEIEIDPKDLKVDVFRSSGPGGQSVNTTDSAVRITHLPTGLVVTCQDEKSQLKNKKSAMRVLRARLHDKMQQEQFEKETKERKAMVGSGDRSEKIRTYNFPDRRVTDHRIGLTIHQLPAILDGDLDEMTDALMEAEHKTAMKE